MGDIKCICLILFFIAGCTSEAMTFENVIVEWTLENDLFFKGHNSTITSVKYFKQIPQNVTSKQKVKARVRGTVKILYKDSVADMDYLSSLILTDTKLEEIQPVAFKNLELNTLDLSHNKLREIKYGVFVNLSISELLLNNNKISVLQVGAFQNIPNVHQINLERNHLTQISKGVIQNCKVERIIFSYNHISRIEPGFFDDLLPTEIHLYADNNNLQELNPNVFKSHDLYVLDLKNNSISEIRFEDLANVRKLRELYLSGNRLKRIHGGLFGSSLIKLDLSYNEIDDIDSTAFNNLDKLVGVSIEGNKLDAWNRNWFHCSSGNSIDVLAGGNHFQVIPKVAAKACLNVVLD